MTLTPEELAKIEARAKNAMTDLIPHSRDDIPALIAALKEAWAEIERIRPIAIAAIDHLKEYEKQLGGRNE